MVKKRRPLPRQQTAEVIEKPAEMKLLAPPKELPKPKKHKLHRLNTPMQTHHFVISQLAILVVSLVFLAGIYRLLNNDSFKTIVANTTYSPVTAHKASFNLEINQPDNEFLTFTKTIVISGSTSPKASVLFAIAGTETSFDSIEANISGEFQKTISLFPGLNQIEISSFDKEGNTKTETRLVYYSEEQLQ